MESGESGEIAKGRVREERGEGEEKQDDAVLTLSKKESGKARIENR